MDTIVTAADSTGKDGPDWTLTAGQEINRDHLPSKSLLRELYPPNLPQVAVCRPCNEGFSRDEEYLSAFLGCVLAGSSVPERQSDARAARILSHSGGLRARLEKAKTQYRTRGGETRPLWSPETDRVERVILKNARGHACFELGEPMLSEPVHIRALPLEYLTSVERNEFERVEAGNFWPEVGSRMLTRAVTGQDFADGWVIVAGRNLQVRRGAPKRHPRALGNRGISRHRSLLERLSPGLRRLRASQRRKAPQFPAPQE